MLLNKYLKTNLGSIVTEAVRSRDLEKAIGLISSCLSKRKIYTMPEIRDLSVGNKRKLGVIVWTDKNEGGCFVWDLGMSSQIEAVLFTRNFDEMNVAWINNEPYTWDLEVQAKGANTVQMCKLVEKVLSGKVAMTSNAVRNEIQDAQLFESLVIENADDMIEQLKKKRGSIAAKLSSAKKKGDTTKIADLQAQYDELKAQIADARLSIQTSVPSVLKCEPDVDTYEGQFEEEMRATPEERFEDMEAYIGDVIAGVKPLALLCGAPGIGKTFRVTQALKKAGLDMNIDWKLLKAKSTASALYTTMHDFKNQGQLIVMDDCDNVFKDDDAINLLKAAYDSSDERWVTWNTSRKIPMDTDLAEQCDDADFDPSTGRWYYPRQFLYEGSGIIITNYRAGQIDTAVRNRALVCDLDFTPQEMIDLICSLAPKIAADKYTMGAKQQALDYLQELVDKKAPVELSIRSFTLCTGIFASDSSTASKMRRIREQMRLQAARGGKKY